MSQNHPTDNIYNILDTLKALEPTPAETVKAQAQHIRESVESQGSILKGLREVSTTEQRLAKMFEESNFDKTTKAIEKSGNSEKSAKAIAATIGREKLGQAEMTRRSVAGRKKANEAMDEAIEECAMCEAGTCTEHTDQDAVNENGLQQLSIEQLATISDTALDSAYGYGRSQPGNTFGWQANLKSAAFAKQMIDKGVADIEAISDAIHKGWNVTAQAFVKNPQMFDDSKTMAPEKLQAKIAQRQKLMTQQYAQLPEDEKEKDRVVARAMLQAITGGQQEVGEDMEPEDLGTVAEINRLIAKGMHETDAIHVVAKKWGDNPSELASFYYQHNMHEGTVHKGTYGTSYDPSDEEKKTKPKHVPKAGKTGRPKQDKPTKAQSAAEKKEKAPAQKQSPKSAKTWGMKDGEKFDNRDKQKDKSVAEAAKWRDPKYKGKLFTQKKGDSDDYDSISYGYDTPERPKKDPGQKRRMGGIGDKWDNTDKLKSYNGDTGNTTGGAHWKGTGGSTDMKDWKPSPYKDRGVNTQGPRKGLVSKSGIGDVKNRIKSALGTHPAPVLPESTRKIGEANLSLSESLARVERKVILEANLKQYMETHHMTIDEMLECLSNDAGVYKESGHMTELLRDCMEMHKLNKPTIADETVNEPYRPEEVPAINRAHLPPLDLHDVIAAQDRATHVPTKLDAPAGVNPKAVRDELTSIHSRAAESIEPFNEELQKLAELAGLTMERNDGNLANNYPPYGEVTRGDIVAGALDQDQEGGKNKFDEEELEEGPWEFKNAADRTAPGEHIEIDGHDTGRIKHESASVNELRRLAGMPVDETDDDPLDEDDVEVDIEVDNEPANTAHNDEDYSMRASTMGPGEGDPGEKRQFFNQPMTGDNRMSEGVDSQLESRLATEYESIKRQKQ